MLKQIENIYLTGKYKYVFFNLHPTAATSTDTGDGV